MTTFGEKMREVEEKKRSYGGGAEREGCSGWREKWSHGGTKRKDIHVDGGGLKRRDGGGGGRKKGGMGEKNGARWEREGWREEGVRKERASN
jgi:hypothetical protein